MEEITKYISFGHLNIKYLIMILSAIVLLFIGRGGYFLYLGGLNEKDNHKLLKTFLKYIGFSLCYVGEIIRKKLTFKNNEDEEKLLNSDVRYNDAQKKEASKHFINPKDKIYIIIIALAHLVNEFLAITLKAISRNTIIKFDNLYNTIEFLFLFFISYFIFKLVYYRHQKISIILIILCEILKIMVLQIKKEGTNQENNDGKFSFISLMIQILKAFFDSVFIGYSKVLMEDKFFSPYKVLYIFGFINGLLVLLLYFIFTCISYESNENNKNNIFFELEYNGKLYFDNFYGIFEGFNFLKFIGLLLDIIGVTGSCLFFNFIVNNFTICHLFFYYQIYSFYGNIKSGSGSNLFFVIIISIFELFITIVFLELIILHCFKLDKNVKKNIVERSVLDVDNKDDNDDENDLNDDNYIVNYDNNDSFHFKNNRSSKLVPLNPMDGIEE